MSTGTKGQQVIDTVRDAHHFMHEGFGTFYVVALVLAGIYALLWLAKQRRDLKRRRAAKRRPAPRARKATGDTNRKKAA